MINSPTLGLIFSLPWKLELTQGGAFFIDFIFEEIRYTIFSTHSFVFFLGVEKKDPRKLKFLNKNIFSLVA